MNSIQVTDCDLTRLYDSLTKIQPTGDRALPQTLHAISERLGIANGVTLAAFDELVDKHVIIKKWSGFEVNRAIVELLEHLGPGFAAEQLLGDEVARLIAKHERRRAVVGARVGSWVYLISNPATGLHKIGYAANVDRRRAKLSRDLDSDLKIVAKVKCADVDALSVEKALHKMHAADRKHGEWFELSRQQVLLTVEKMHELTATTVS